MPDEDLYHDIIDRHGTVTERIRKLEIMPHGLAITPSQWRPQPYLEFYEAVAGLVTLLGVWDDDPWQEGGATGGPAMLPAASHAMYDELLAGTFASRRQWTLFLYQLKALPDPRGWPIFTGPEWTVVSGGDTAQARRMRWTGLPAGEDWSPKDESETWIPLGPTAPGGDTVPFWDDSDEAVRSGSFTSTREDPIASRDNEGWQGNRVPGTGEAIYVPCTGPDMPAYNGFSYPGIPVFYDVTGPCAFEGLIPPGRGTVTYVGRYLPLRDAYLARPPRPPSAAGPPGHNLHPFYPAHNYPGMTWLRNGVIAILGSYSAINGWCVNAYNRAAAYEQGAAHYNWQSLKLAFAWGGRVEAQVRDQQVVLRGHARYRSGPEQHDPGSVFEWPPFFPQSHQGYATARHLFLAQDSAGRLLQHTISPVAGGIDVAVTTGGGFPDEVGFDWTIYYDGVTIPVKYPWP